MLRRVLKLAGYVPSADVDLATAALECDVQHKDRSLEHEVLLRARADREVEFLRQLTTALVAESPVVRDAIDRLDRATNALDKFVREQWSVRERYDATA
jgi:hypothetical protein